MHIIIMIAAQLSGYYLSNVKHKYSDTNLEMHYLEMEKCNVISGPEYHSNIGTAGETDNHDNATKRTTLLS